MARRSKSNAIDWDAIERQYRLGQRSNAQLGVEFGVDPTSIAKRAKKLGWVADKADEVAAEASAILIRASAGIPDANSGVNSGPNATPTPLEIKAAGKAVADVVLGHRKSLVRLAALRDTMADELKVLGEPETQGALRADINAISEGASDAQIYAAKRRLERAVSLPERVDTLKKLAEVDERIRRGEREAFGLAKDDGGGDQVDRPGKALTDAERASRLATLFARNPAALPPGLAALMPPSEARH